MVDTELTGDPDGRPHREINPDTGQQLAYVVLTAEERAKGFVEPYRDTYVHVGPPAPKNLRDLTLEELKRFAQFKYVKYEKFDESQAPNLGKYWTQEELDRLGGCGVATVMCRPIAETYARMPHFYSGTFCNGCKKHFPLNEFVWDGTNQRLGTRSTK